NMQLAKAVVRRRIKVMEESGIQFETDTEIGVDISKETLTEEYGAIILCTGSQNARDLPLVGRMAFGMHFAVDSLTEHSQYINDEGKEPSNSAEGKKVIVIGAGDTGADCVATALRENCKSIVQFNKYTKQPEAIEFDENSY